MDKICTKPFNKIEIDSYGDVYTCCPIYINYNKIGNIWNENITSIDEIWNSYKAKRLREKIINNDFSLCNLDICREKNLEKKNEEHSITPPLPEYITLAYDKECNIQCITCRDKKIENTETKKELYNKRLDSIILPLLENAKEITISGSGEAFYSEHSRLLIKKLTKSNLKAKFNIYTNGLLFNENNCKQLGLENRINNVFISIHSLNEKTYNKIMVGSNLKVVLNNLKWASQQENINRITINSVISNLNYKEIPNLINLAKRMNVYISFSVYSKWGTKLDSQYKELAVWEPAHKKHNDFKKIIEKAKKINYKKCDLTQIIPTEQQ